MAAERTPAVIAIERLAKMAMAGADAHKMVTALNNILVSWGAEDLPPDDLRERVEQLQADIDAGLQAAEDYVSEADTPTGKVAAQKQLDALTGARERLTQIVKD